MRGSKHCGAQQVTRARQAEGAGRRRRRHRSGLPHPHRRAQNTPGRGDRAYFGRRDRGRTNFVQVYGQTELCGAVTALSNADHRDAARPGLQLSAGKAVLGSEIQIVDPETGNRLPAGEAGEIWVRSNQNMTGYLNRPEATADTITADEWVRTGDIGRLDAEGYIYIEDRLKDMVITGGENVYGPEVESVLVKHPAIADAAIIGVPDDYWGESVKAIVVTTDEVDAGEIIEFCRRHLATYKCPRTVDFISELPRNASGKILKTQLREPYWKGRTRKV